MPYTFHSSTPTRYPSADSLFPASAETLSWYPEPYDDGAVERAIAVRARVVSYLQQHGGQARLADVVHYAGRDAAAREAVRGLVASGAVRQVLRKTGRDPRPGRSEEPLKACAWLVLP